MNTRYVAWCRGKRGRWQIMISTYGLAAATRVYELNVKKDPKAWYRLISTKTLREHAPTPKKS